MAIALSWCRVCGKADWNDGRHRCPPKWEVEVDYGRKGERAWEGSRTVRAGDEESAAEEWADRYDSYGDYTIVGGAEQVIRIRPASSDDDAAWKVFRVTGEHVPRYRAEELYEKSEVPSGFNHHD